MNTAKQYGGFAATDSTIRTSIFMSDVDTVSDQPVAGPSGTSRVDEVWSPQRMADISSVFSDDGHQQQRSLEIPQFGYGAFTGKRGGVDWALGRERTVSLQMSPMDRPSSVGPYGLAGRSFRNDRLEPSPTIRRARSQYHSTSNSRATSPIPIPATVPTLRTQPMVGEDGMNEFIIGDQPRRRSNSADLSDIGHLQERRPGSARRSGTGDMMTSTSAGTESSVRGGKQKLQEGRPPGPRLPPQLRATLMAEKDLSGQEMRSEALLQRYILSNPTSLPVTPRMPRGSRGRMFSSFSRTNSDSSRSPSPDSSDDEGPFAVDEAIESDDGSRRAVVGTVLWDPSRMEVDMMHFGGGFGGGGEGSVASTSDAGSGMNIDGPSAAKRPSFAKPSMNGLNGFGYMAVDEVSGGVAGNGASGSPRSDHVVPSMLWRESPSSHGRINKRKAISEDTRFEPYSKRPRGAAENSSSSGSGHSHGHSHNHSPYHPNSPGVNPIPISPISTETMDIGGSNGNGNGQGRAIAYARSRAGSPSAASVSLAMRAISPVASSPLSNGMNQHNPNRPIIGMGGLGMLLLSKRNANAMSVGMGLMAGGDGESSAVAEGIEGMDVTAEDRDEDESMAD